MEHGCSGLRSIQFPLFMLFSSRCLRLSILPLFVTILFNRRLLGAWKSFHDLLRDRLPLELRNFTVYITIYHRHKVPNALFIQAANLLTEVNIDNLRCLVPIFYLLTC